MMIRALYLMEIKRLFQQKQVLWWPLLSLIITTTIYLFVYQFPLHIGSSPQTFWQILGVITIWFLPLFVVNDLQLGGRYDRDGWWLNMPINPRHWLIARLLAWVSLQLGGVLFGLLWFIEGSYWYFFDVGILLGNFLQLLLITIWTIALSFMWKSYLRRSWITLIAVYGVQFFLMSSGFFASVWQEQQPWLALWLEFISYTYRTHNGTIGLFSLGDLSYWVLLIGVLGVITEVRVYQLANYKPLITRKKQILFFTLLISALLFMLYPLEIDFTIHRLYTPHHVVKDELKNMRDPILLERLTSKERSHLGTERWLMRRLLRYQSLSRYVNVIQRVVTRSEAQGLGLQSIGELSGVDQVAGLLSYYHDLATIEANFVSIDQLDEMLTLALRRLKRVSPKRLLLIIDESQQVEDYSLLTKTLAKEFDIEWLTPNMLEWLPYLEVDGYIILGGHHLDEQALHVLESEWQKGKGIWINTMGVRISGNPDYPPLRLPYSALDHYLEEKGMRVGRNLLLDPDGYLMESGAGLANYPLWLSGRWAGNNNASNALVGVAPLMSVALNGDHPNWRSILYSSHLTREQEGYLEFNLFQLWHRSWQEEGAEYWLAGEYQQKESAGRFVVMGSTTWLSNMMEDAQVEQNATKALLLARYILQDDLILGSSLRYNIIQEKKRPFAIHEMGRRYKQMIIRMMVAGLISIVVMVVLARRAGRE